MCVSRCMCEWVRVDDECICVFSEPVLSSLCDFPGHSFHFYFYCRWLTVFNLMVAFEGKSVSIRANEISVVRERLSNSNKKMLLFFCLKKISTFWIIRFFCNVFWFFVVLVCCYGRHWVSQIAPHGGWVVTRKMMTLYLALAFIFDFHSRHRHFSSCESGCRFWRKKISITAWGCLRFGMAERFLFFSYSHREIRKKLRVSEKSFTQRKRKKKKRRWRPCTAERHNRRFRRPACVALATSLSVPDSSFFRIDFRYIYWWIYCCWCVCVLFISGVRQRPSPFIN